MKTNKEKAYSVADSAQRIKDILISKNDLESSKTIPNSETLSYNGGYYVYHTAVFVDLRDSKYLYDDKKKKTVAKIIKSFLSEAVAIFNSAENCEYLYIEGDCVWGVFNTPKKADIKEVVNVVFRLSSLIDIINHVGTKNLSGFHKIKAGVGVAYGQSLMVKGGHKGSGLNEVVWIGDVVGNAARYSALGSKDSNYPVISDSSIIDNLDDQKYKDLFSRGVKNRPDLYQSSAYNIGMRQWIKDNP